MAVCKFNGFGFFKSVSSIPLILINKQNGPLFTFVLVAISIKLNFNSTTGDDGFKNIFDSLFLYWIGSPVPDIIIFVCSPKGKLIQFNPVNVNCKDGYVPVSHDEITLKLNLSYLSHISPNNSLILKFFI